MKEMLPAVRPGEELLPGVPSTVNLTELPATDVRARAKALYVASRVLSMALAETLDFIIDRALYNTWHWDSFEKYCDGELGMHPKQAYEYVRIFRSLRDNTPLTRDEIETLPTQKANALRKLADAGLLKEREKAEEWLETAQDLSLDQVKEQVVRALEMAAPKDEHPTPDHPVKILHFPLFAEQLAVWEEAEARARTLAESDKPGHLLTCICTAFNAEAWDGKKASLSKLCLSLERTFGIKLIAFEPGEETHVLYGEGALTALAAEDSDASEEKEE